MIQQVMYLSYHWILSLSNSFPFVKNFAASVEFSDVTRQVDHPCDEGAKA
jgi:hypothetical protein